MLRYFLVHGGAGGQLAPSATVESVRHFLLLFRTNYTALARYQPRPSSRNGLFFYASQHDEFNTDGFARAWVPYFQRLELIGVPGNQTSMNLPPNCDGITQRILAVLETRVGPRRPLHPLSPSDTLGKGRKLIFEPSAWPG